MAARKSRVVKQKAAPRSRRAEKRRAANPRIGSSFGDFLEEDRLRGAVTALALKRVIAWQIAAEMERQDLTKKGMAEAMETSRSALDRLLDPDSEALSIRTLDKAARALGKRIVFELAG